MSEVFVSALCTLVCMFIRIKLIMSILLIAQKKYVQDIIVNPDSNSLFDWLIRGPVNVILDLVRAHWIPGTGTHLNRCRS